MKYHYQIVMCSERAGRCFRREIAVSEVTIMVTAVEMLPQYYEIPLEKMRRDNEGIGELTGTWEYWSGYEGCPFCGNRNVFVCGCGWLSCRNVTKRVHECPKCRKICNPSPTKTLPVSNSGFTHGGREIPDYSEPAPRPVERSEPPRLEGPDRDKLEARDEVRRLLAERRLGIEDKRGKK